MENQGVAQKRQAGQQLRPWLVPRVRASDLARAAGVSHQYVSQVLNGSKPPSDRLLDAARGLGLPVDVIFRDTEGGEATNEKRRG
jgi:transcriptional regulator with XRE-family HTH domain